MCSALHGRSIAALESPFCEPLLHVPRFQHQKALFRLNCCVQSRSQLGAYGFVSIQGNRLEMPFRPSAFDIRPPSSRQLLPLWKAIPPAIVATLAPSMGAVGSHGSATVNAGYTLDKARDQRLRLVEGARVSVASISSRHQDSNKPPLVMHRNSWLQCLARGQVIRSRVIPM